nr:aspartate/glutamate racemase family protein [Virgibacillus sp. YIM 98842]
MKKAKIGILMLDTQFYRPAGDIGNKHTFPFSVVYKMVEGASISKVVKERDTGLIEPFVQAAKELEEEGIRAITTSCGFLALFQKEIQQQLTVPFYSSSLLQIPMASITAGEPIGIVTASESSLTTAHLSGVNAHHQHVIIKGMDNMPKFSGAIVHEEIELNEAAVKEEMKQITSELISSHPGLKAIILECTNMPPYRDAIREVTKLPIFDITTLVNYVYLTI